MFEEPATLLFRLLVRIRVAPRLSAFEIRNGPRLSYSALLQITSMETFQR